MAFWNRKSEKRSLPAENALPLGGSYPSSPIWPYRPITPARALQIGDVWSAVRVLSDAASSLPLHVYRRNGEGRERVTSGKLVDVLERPGPGSSQADLISTLMSHLLIFGNAYLGKYREGGEVNQLALLDPERVRPELENGRLRWRYTPSTGAQRMLTEADVVHVKGLTTDGLIGLSAVTQASRVLGLSDELVKHALAYFDSGEFQRPAGVLRVAPESSFASQDRTKEKLRADAKPHGVLVIEGEAEYHPIADKPDDAQFVEQRRLAAQEIARVFRIPPHMLGAPTGDSLTYSTVEQESINFVRYSLTPWLRRIELAISNDGDLAFQRQFVRFEVDALLRADSKTRAEVYSRALDPTTGWMDVNEVRALEDLPPRDETPARVESPPSLSLVEARSHEDRSREDLADAIRALATKQHDVNINLDVNGAKTKRHATFIRDEDGRPIGAEIVDEPQEVDFAVSTNGSGDPKQVEALNE
jgi:HK97 family phage portal protein